MCLAPSRCRGRPAHPDGGDVATAAVSSQRRSDHPALLAALPLHQHVALQQAGDGHRVGAVLSLLGGHPPAAAQPHRGLGRETGSGARRRLPPQSNRTGKRRMKGNKGSVYWGTSRSAGLRGSRFVFYSTVF